MEIFGQPTSALPEKNGVPKKHPLGFGRFFSEVTFLQAQCHLAWRSWCHSCISDESWGEFWSINFDKKTWVRQVFSKEKLLGLWLWYLSWGWISHELSTHPCHIVSWFCGFGSCIHGIHMFVLSIFTPDIRLHSWYIINTNQRHVCVYWKCTWKVCFFSHPYKAKRWPWMCKQVSFDWFGSASPPVQLLKFFPNHKES